MNGSTRDRFPVAAVVAMAAYESWSKAKKPRKSPNGVLPSDGRAGFRRSAVVASEKPIEAALSQSRRTREGAAAPSFNRDSTPPLGKDFGAATCLG